MDRFANINQLISSKAVDYVLCLAESENITRAAEKLFISQPALSRYIRNVEEILGCRLFEKEGKRSVLTYAGECFVKYARTIKNTEELMAHELANCAANKTGRIRFGLPVLRSSYLLPKIVPEFMRAYPGVELELYEKHADTLTELWESNKLDFMVSNFVPSDFSTRHMIIKNDRMLIAMSPDNPLAALADKPQPGEHYGQIDLALLKDESFILQHPDQRTRQLADVICADAGFEPKSLLLVRSVEASLRMARDGCGICFCGESMANSISLPEPPLYFLCKPNSIMELAVCYRDVRQQPEYFGFFLELLRRKIFNEGDLDV